MARKQMGWAIVAVLAAGGAAAAPVTFTLLTHQDNVTVLPQQCGHTGVSGDHLIQTADDITDPAYNPRGSFTFGFMNPIGEWGDDYPPGYAEGIHSMQGALELDIDLAAGGGFSVTSLSFGGVAYPGKTGPTSFEYLVIPGDPATADPKYQVDGVGNSGTFGASDALDWSLEAQLDLYKDLPPGGTGGIDMTMDDWSWSGFLIPTEKLTGAGMALVTLDDALGYFLGTSEDFEAWLIEQVAPRLPDEATWLLFAQAEGQPDWNSPSMGGWDPLEGIVGETIVAYSTAGYQPDQIPEPTTLGLLLCGAAVAWGRRRR